ncbi:uncharacterized protein LOC105693722 [Athalia rosae]|uniref:uncharacterized protein LOC105693722 n=1 Tax=Athalia rosae TaxID=37344 RepID=UPI00203345C3|nr:uncharacterized protein LOC105693722 [Athalia rosae]
MNQKEEPNNIRRQFFSFFNFYYSNRPNDCFADRIEESWQIDPKKASKITKIDEDAKNRAHRLILDTLKSVYAVDFTQHISKIDKNGSVEEANLGSELLNYINNLFHDPHNEKILAPLPTAKRVFGYMRPQNLHRVLSAYQDGYGKTGGIIMTRNANLAETSKRREALREKKFGNEKIGDPCSPERLADMHFT